MKRIIGSEKCYGCQVCANTCAYNAIIITKNDYGFCEPAIDSNKCVSCNACVNACPATSNNYFHDVKEVFAVRLKDAKVIKNCASGGAFEALAQLVLRYKGVVVGCIFDKDLVPMHVSTENEAGLKPMHGSKYVQSNTGMIYREVKKHLLANRYVLFTGTPCQVAALYLYLGKDYEKLYTCDLICHGVSNTEIWKDYLAHEEKMIGEKIVNIVFRSKKYGWGSLYMMIMTASGKKVYKSAVLSSYYYMYLKGLIYRESCYYCEFSQEKRIADFTIGDYWGVLEENPRLFSKHGVSVLMINTRKALAIKDELRYSLLFNQISYDSVKRHNKALNHPVDRPQNDTMKIWKGQGYVELDSMFEPVRAEYREKHLVHFVKKNLKAFLQMNGLYKGLKVKHEK